MAQEPGQIPEAGIRVAEAGRAWPDRRAFLALALALALAAILIRLPYLAEPFDTDEGGYAYIARALLDGLVPYRDAWDNKPPLIFVVYAGALAFADRIESIRLLAAIVVAGSTLLMIGVAREAFDRRTGIVAGALFVFATTAPRLQGTNANTEIFLLPGWIGAAWAILIGLRTPDRRWPWPVAGALIGLALLAKPVAGWAIVAVAATFLILIARGALSWRVAFARLAALAAGVVIVLVPVAAYFAAQGALGDAVHATVLFNRLYVARNVAFALDRYGPLAMFFAPNREVVLENPLLWLFGVTGLVTVALSGCSGRLPSPTVRAEGPAMAGSGSSRASAGPRRPSRRGCRAAERSGRTRTAPDPALLFLGLWTLAGFVGAKTGWLDLAHYYLQVVPALALWCAVYLVRILPLLGRSNPTAPWFIGAVGVALVVWSLVSWRPIWLSGDPDRFHALKFPFPDRGDWDVEASGIAAEVRARTNAGATVFIWGREPQIYYYAGRRSASRFIHDRPAWIEPGVLDQIRADLAAAGPALVLDTLDPILFPEATEPIQSVLPPGYRPIGRLGFADVYQRDDASRPSG